MQSVGVVTQEPTLTHQHPKDMHATIPQELVASITKEQSKAGTKLRDATQEPSLKQQKDMKETLIDPQERITRIAHNKTTTDNLKNITTQLMLPSTREVEHITHTWHDYISWLSSQYAKVS